MSRLLTGGAHFPTGDGPTSTNYDPESPPTKTQGGGRAGRSPTDNRHGGNATPTVKSYKGGAQPPPGNSPAPGDDDGSFDGRAYGNRFIFTTINEIQYFAKIIGAPPPEDESRSTPNDWTWTIRIENLTRRSEQTHEKIISWDELRENLIDPRPPRPEGQTTGTNPLYHTDAWDFYRETYNFLSNAIRSNPSAFDKHIMSLEAQHTNPPPPNGGEEFDLYEQGQVFLRRIFNISAKQTPHINPQMAAQLYKFRFSLRLHHDHIQENLNHALHLATKLEYAVKYIRGSYSRNAERNDPPNPADYPLYGTADFAALANCRELDMSQTHQDPGGQQPDDPPPDDPSPDLSPPNESQPDEPPPNNQTPEDDAMGQDGPTAADETIRDEDGNLPDTPECVNAKPMDWFLCSPFLHPEHMPRSCIELWARTISRATDDLINAIQSTGPDRNKRIGTAGRWYLGLPQLMLRDMGSHRDRNAHIIKNRLNAYLNGHYKSVIDQWLHDRDKASRKRKTPRADTPQTRLKHGIQLIYQGHISRGIRIIDGHGKADPDDRSVTTQMREKHPTSTHTWPTPPRRSDALDIPDLSLLDMCIRESDPKVGVGPRGFKSSYAKVLLTGNFQNSEAKEALRRFTELGRLYLDCTIPAWFRRQLGAGLLTPLAKAEPTPGQTVDARPTKAEDIDTALWCQALQRALTPRPADDGSVTGVRSHLEPQQLAVGVSGGCEILALGMKLKLDHANRHNASMVILSIDLKNAHNAFNRLEAQRALEKLSDHDPSLSSLALAHTAISRQHNPIYVRTKNNDVGLHHLCDSESGGGQGNALTNIIFPILINEALKKTESTFDVEIKAIQDDISIMGDPDEIFGNGRALEVLLTELQNAGLEPQMKKFQCLASNEEARSKIPSDIRQPFVISDPIERARFVERMQSGMAKETAEDLIPPGAKAYGIWICGTAIGSDDYVETKLREIQDDLFGTEDEQADTPNEGKLLSLVRRISNIDPHAAHSVTLYSIQNRIDYVLATHLPSQTRDLATACDNMLRRACRACYGTDLLSPEGQPGSQFESDPSFVSARALTKISHGGAGIRLTTQREPYLNAWNNVGRQLQCLWPSLSDIIGGAELASETGENRWATFYDTNSIYAIELRNQWVGLQALNTTTAQAAGFETPPESLLDTSPDSFGHGFKKLHKAIFDHIRKLEHTAVLKRATSLDPDDPRRQSTLQTAGDKFATVLLNGTPEAEYRYLPREFQSAVQNFFGVPQTICAHIIGCSIASNTKNRTEKVDPYGRHIKSAIGVRFDSIRQFHDAAVNVLSRLLHKARVKHRGGAWGNTRTCKDIFSAYLNNLNESERWIQGMIPDNLIDTRGLELEDDSPLRDRQILTDHKTLSPCLSYVTNKTEPHHAVNKRSRGVETHYKRTAKKLDEKLGYDTTKGPVTEKLEEYNEGKVLGLVIGAFGEHSDTFTLVADLIARGMANEHQRYYEVTPEEAKAIYLPQIRKELGHTAHRGWARVLSDRIRDIVIFPGAPRARASTHFDNEDDDATANYYHSRSRMGTGYGPGPMPAAGP